jgi:hypothetical protein
VQRRFLAWLIAETNVYQGVKLDYGGAKETSGIRKQLILLLPKDRTPKGIEATMAMLEERQFQMAGLPFRSFDSGGGRC